MLKIFEEGSNFDIFYALKYAGLISLGITILCTVYHPFFLSGNMTGLKIRVALSGLIYKKVFKLNKVEFDADSSGKFINMLSTDCSRIESTVLFSPFLFIAPIELAVVFVVLVNVVDQSMLGGMLVIFLAIPCQAMLGKVFDQMRRIASKKCDKRIDLLNEILNGIKIIKMYCWEEPFKKITQILRK